MSLIILTTALSASSSWLWDVVSHNWALISIFSTVVALTITPALILRKYVRICLNIIQDTPPPLSMGPRDFVPEVGERVSFRAFDGLSLSGMFLYGQSEGPSRGLIVFAHEFASDAMSCARYCRSLLEAGYDVFSFDFRGHGQSGLDDNYKPRQWVSDRELSDILGVLAYVEEWLTQRGRPLRIGLFGISRGGAAAILGADQHDSVKAIVTDGAFSSDTTLEYFMKRWAYIFARVRFVYESHPPAFWRFLRWLLFCECRRKLNCRFPSVRKTLMKMKPRPMFFIHGEKDSYIPVAQSEMLYALAGPPKHIWIVQAAKHNQSVIVQPEQYADRIVGFFDRYMAQLPGAGRMFDHAGLEDVDRHAAEPRTQVTARAMSPAKRRALANRSNGRT